MVGKKLIWRLCPSFLAVTLIALVAATAYFSHTFRAFHLQQTQDDLRLLGDTVLPEITEILKQGDVDQMDALCKRLGRAGDGQVRFTVITPAGQILGDSDEKPTVMKDHSNRQEIIEALRNGFGHSVRRSPTLGKSMMYVGCPHGHRADAP